MELLAPGVYDEDGNRIGDVEPLITKEQAMELLNGTDLDPGGSDDE